MIFLDNLKWQHNTLYILVQQDINGSHIEIDPKTENLKFTLKILAKLILLFSDDLEWQSTTLCKLVQLDINVVLHRNQTLKFKISCSHLKI